MKILWLQWRELYQSRRLVDAAGSMGASLDVVDVPDLCFVADGEREGVFRGEADVTKTYDVFCIRTFSPSYISEVLTLARLFAEAGKTVIDRSLTDEPYAISKMHDYLVLAGAGIAVPRTYHAYDRAEVEKLAGGLGYPCVLKGIHGAQGRHVFKANNVQRLRHTLRRYADGELLVQEYLDADEDYRVLVVGYQALPLFVKRTPRPGDFRTNVAADGEGVPARLSDFPELRDIAERAARTLRRELAGVDIRNREGRPVILEVNRQPDFEGFEEATGLDVAREFLRHMVEAVTVRRL